MRRGRANLSPLLTPPACSNFASFVRQLNNYGFRKCHTDRYEFGVAGFQRGSPELLKSLKRHDAQRSSRKAGGGGGSRAERSERGGGGGAAAGDGPIAALELGAFGGMHTEVEQLKRDRMVLLKEVVRLRESGARTADQVQDLSARLAATESLQQQMLAFLQQHISPSLVAANSHLIPGRKRRHLLLPPSPGREDAAPVAMDGLAGGDSLAMGLEFMEGLSMEHLASAAAAPASLGAPGGLSLLELPDGHGDSPSYHADVPSPVLPSVMAMPSGSDVFEWSDLSGLDSPGPSPGHPSAIPRIDNAEIHAIMRDLRVAGDATEVESTRAAEVPDRPGADGG